MTGMIFGKHIFNNLPFDLENQSEHQINFSRFQE